MHTFMGPASSVIHAAIFLLFIFPCIQFCLSSLLSFVHVCLSVCVVCVLMFACVRARRCECAHTYMRMCMEAQGQLQESSSIVSTLFTESGSPN